MVVFNQESSRQEIVSRNTGRYDDLMISSSEEEEETEEDDDDDDDNNNNNNNNGTAFNLGNLPGLGNRCTASSSSTSSSSSSERSNSPPQLVVIPSDDDDDDTDNYVNRARRRFLPRMMHARISDDTMHNWSTIPGNANHNDNNDANDHANDLAFVGQIWNLIGSDDDTEQQQQQQRRFHRNDSDSDDDAASSAASSSMGSMPGLQERAREDSSTDGDGEMDRDWNVRLPRGGGLDDDELVPHPRNANHNGHDHDANDHAVVGRIGMIDQLFMDQLRIRDRRNLWGSDTDTDTDNEEDEDEREMPRLIQRNQQNHDSSSEEEDDDDDTDTEEESTVDGRGGLGLPQTPWVIRNRYRYHLETIPHPVWPIILAQAQHTPRYLNGLHDKHTGVYQLLRKGPLFLQHTNTNDNENEEHYG